MGDEPSIARLVREERALELIWSEGPPSRFTYLWLRDNCTCTACGDTMTGARFLRLTDIPADISAREARIDDSGRLAVEWSGDGHISFYEPSWLHECCHARSRHLMLRPVPWDRDIARSLPEFAYAQVNGDEGARIDLFEALFTFGFVLLRQVPARASETERIAALLGPVRAQSYGQVFDIWTRDNAEILSNTRSALPPHVDEPFRTHPPGLFVLHCLVAVADGGGSNTLVDGFMLAKDLREREPEIFRTLCQVPVPHHRRREGKFDHAAEAPVFTLDAEGAVTGFRFAERSAAPLSMPAEMVDRVYTARRALLERAYSPAFQIDLSLAPGEAFVIDNHRLMHGRAAFAGERHMRQCNIDRDDAFSRYRLLCRQHGRRPGF